MPGLDPICGRIDNYKIILAVNRPGRICVESFPRFRLGPRSVLYRFSEGLASPFIRLILTADPPQAINGGSRPQAKLPVPWRAILTSVPLLSLLVAHLGYLWGYWVLIACTPSYINNLLDVGIEWNGLLSSAPQVAMMVSSMLFGWLGDQIESRHLLSTTANRRLFNTIGMCGPGLMCLLIALFGASNPALALSVLTVYGGLISASFAGSLINYVDLSPNFSGVTFAFGNMVGAFGSAFAPYAEGFFVDRKDPMPGWSNVFYLTAAAYFVLNGVWYIWCSAEVQPWNNPPRVDTDYLEKTSSSGNLSPQKTGIRSEVSFQNKE
ncbi:putative inorganic phosphate cotransporter [Thrips palmi]|uniref:Inorganic phosphate cotransporter n=1 Tax=Thrips palmi TaxID=161013 RepID=A0A6P9AG91_THRPL|nr:putative inorganic phosphate cotransporter [Thrips palmi]